MQTKFLRLGLVLVAVFALGVFVAPKKAEAATKTWAGGTSTDWATASNWSPSGVPAAGDDVIIGNFAPGNQPTLSASTTINSLTINGRSATIGTRGGCLTINTGQTLTISNNLAINGSSGGGTGVTCSAANSTGIIATTTANIIVGGNVSLANSTGGPPEEAIIVMGSGTLSVAGNWTKGSSSTFTAGTGTVTLNGTTQSIGGSTTTFQNLTTSGSGTKTLAVNSTVNGALTVNAGTTLALSTFNLSTPTSLTMEGGATTGASITGTGALTLGGNVTVNDATTGTGGATISAPVALGATRTFTVADDGTAATDLTISSVISGATFGITKAGAGTMALSGANTFTGAVTVNVGILTANTVANAGTNSALGTGGGTPAISIGASGTLQYTGTGHSSSRAIVLTGSGGTLDASGSGTLTLSGGVTGNTFNLVLTGTGVGVESGVIGTTSGNVTKNGTGTWTLSGTNTFTGGTTLSAGTLNINNSQALGTTAGTFTINGGTIDNTSGADITTLNYLLTLNGDFTYSGSVPRNLNLGTGTATLNGDRQITVNAGILSIGGIISASSLSLTKLGAGTLSFGSNSIALNSLTISAGTLTSTSGSLNLNGNFSSDGTFTHNNGTVGFIGTPAAQTIGGSSSTTFNNLSINNSSGSVTLNTAGTVNGVLSLSSDLTASATLTQGSSSSCSGTGDVIGAVARTGLSASTLCFGNASNLITPSSPSSLNVTVSLAKTTPGGFPASTALPRIYTLTSSGTFSSATLRLRYKSAEIPGGVTESTLVLFRKRAGDTKFLQQGGTDTAGGYVQLSGVTEFSDWAFAPSGTPTVLGLVDFKAKLTPKSNVKVKWETGSELSVLGFNLYRQTAGKKWVRLNTNLIPANNTGKVSGAAYKYADNKVQSGKTYRYKLEVVGTSEPSAWSEVVKVTVP